MVARHQWHSFRYGMGYNQVLPIYNKIDNDAGIQQYSHNKRVLS